VQLAARLANAQLYWRDASLARLKGTIEKKNKWKKICSKIFGKQEKPPPFTKKCLPKS
jgi:hypothetical protein